MKKIILSLILLSFIVVASVKAQVRVVIRAPRARIVVARPALPVVVVRPVLPVAVVRPVLPVIIARPIAVVRPLPFVRRRVFIY